MNRFIKILLVVALIVIPLVSSIPVSADEGKNGVRRSPFNIDQSSSEYNTLIGSTIIHTDNGYTNVYAPNKSLICQSKDVEDTVIRTPFGLQKASHVYEIPSGAHIENDQEITKVSLDDEVILTVIDARKSKMIPPDFTGWIEQTNDLTVNNLDLFSADWTVPSNPPSPQNDVADFLFNAIENQSCNSILQPVLEWNQSESGCWTIRAWYGSGGEYYSSTPRNASAGNSLTGVMYYASGLTGWVIQIQNNSTSQVTYITTNVLGTSTLAVFCALEGYNVGSDNDVPDDTTFDNMILEYNSVSVDVTWNPVDGIPAGSGLTYLDAQVYSDAKVKLHTAN